MKSVYSLFFVLLLIVVNVWGANSLQEALQECKTKYTLRIEKGSSSTDMDNFSKMQLLSDCEKAAREEFQSAKESKSSCNSAMKEYTKESKEGTAACRSLSTVQGKTCEDKLNYCTQLNSSAFGGIGSTNSGDDTIDSLLEAVTGIAQASSKTASQVAKKTVSAGCYKFNNEATRKAKKDLDDRIKEVKKDMLEEKRKIDEKNAELRKEENEIKIEQQKVTAELRKTIQKIEVSKREKYSEHSKKLQENATSIRKLNSEIVKEKQFIEKIQFEHQKTMLQFVDNKIKRACKNELAKAKACFVKSSKGEKSEGDSCKGYDFNGSGAKGTAELKNKLKELNEACFEQANSTVSTAKYNFAEQVRNSETKIQELTEQINDANKGIELSQKDLESIAKESDDEKSQEEKNADELMSNFNEKLQSLEKSTSEAVATSQAAMADLQIKLDELTAVRLSENLGFSSSGTEVSGEYMDTILSESTDAFNRANTTRENAIGECCNTEGKKLVDKPGLSGSCSLLQKDLLNSSANGKRIRVRPGQQK